MKEDPKRIASQTFWPRLFPFLNWLQTHLQVGLRGGLVLAMVGISSAIGAPAWLPDDFPAEPTEGPMLCQRTYLTTEQAVATQNAMLAAFPDEAAWNAHARELRMHIREGLNLVPWPTRTPLNPIIRDRREYEGYSVENVAFESVPGYWVTGNLYRPTELQPPYAAVLHTHGHSSDPEDDGWIKHGRFKADVQIRAAALARMGVVSLTIDMFGFGDQRTVLGPKAHRTPIAQRMQTWNAIRAVDFLTSLPEVDGSSLAVTGHSGGGTQAFLLTALEPRIAVSVPVAMVSGYFFGGCPCESGLPIHRSEDHFANNAMIAALAAPRPQLLVSDGGDWTSLTPSIEYPFLQSVYGYFGASDRVGNVHLPDEGHNYGPSKRAALYPFLIEHLGLDPAAMLDADGSIDESRVVVEDPALMRVFPDAESVPDGALEQAEAIDARLTSLQSAS